jgi:hypothetical protein
VGVVGAVKTIIFTLMRLIKFLLAFIFVAFISMQCALAQTSIYKGKKLPPRREGYNAIRIPKSKRAIVCPIFDESGYPYTGIGIKLGDPFALTVKFYFNKHFALVADFGKSASALYSQYYTDLFDSYVPDPGDTLSYFSHEIKSDWVCELKLLYHIDAQKLSPGLRFYTGLGLEARDLIINYQYVTDPPAQPDFLTTQRKRTTQGFLAIVGIEYANFSLPISAFMELEYYYDIVKDPGWTKIQGGVGLRYIF